MKVIICHFKSLSECESKNVCNLVFFFVGYVYGITLRILYMQHINMPKL